MDDEAPDVVLVDAEFDPERPLALLDAIRGRAPRAPVIVMVDRDMPALADEALRLGAVECLPLTSLSGRALTSSIRYAVDRRSPPAERNVEEALRRSELRFREIASEVFLCTHDLEGRILSIDDATSEALGFAPSELVGVSIQDLLVPGRRSDFAGYLQKIARARAAAGCMALMTRGGETRYWNYQNRLSDDRPPVVLGRAVDVTARIRADAVSDLFSRRQAAILDALPIDIGLVGPDGTMLAVNAGWRGFACNEDHGPKGLGEGANYLAACEAGHSATPGREFAAVVRDILDGRRASYDGEWSCEKSGRRRRFHVTVAPVETEAARGAVIMQIDRTELLEAELERRRQASIFENMHDAVVIADTDGKITDWNPSAALMYGLSRERSIGNAVETLAGDRADEARLGEIRRQAETGGRWSGEISHRRSDGSPGVRELVVVGLLGAAGELLGTAGISRDITERRAAEKAVRSSEERYRLLFERNQAGIYRTTIEGRFLEFNDAFARILGYTSEELRTMRAGDLYFSGADRQTAIQDLSRTGMLESSECCLRRRDGSPIWVIENISLIAGPDGRCIEGSFIDITDRRAVEEALRESGERYRFLFDRNPLPMWVYDVDTLRFADVNDAAIAHYGYSRDEFLSMSLFDIRPREDRRGLRATIAREAKRPQPFSAHRHIRKDGSIRHVEVSAVDLPGPDRQRMALARDVTERVAAESALRVSEEKYRKIVDLAPVGIFQTTNDGRFVTCNDAFAQIFGWDSAEAIQAGASDVDLYDSPDERRRAIEALRESGRGDDLQVSMRRRDGSRVWVQLTSRTHRDARGDIERIEGFAIDITSRKNAEDQRERLQSAVLQTAQQWRNTFDAIDTPILIAAADGTVHRLNRAAAELAGRPFTEIIERPLTAVGAGEPWARAAALVRQAAAEASTADVLCRDASNGRTWELSLTPFAAGIGQEPLYIVVARDITPLVELQHSLIRTQSMAAIGALVAGVAHEVRNPLFAISATLDAFELRFGGKQEYERYTTALRSQVERMVALMRDLLDFAKPAVFEPTAVPAADLLVEAAASCSGSAALGGVRLDCTDDEKGVAAKVDRARTLQVFVNLIENAIQHSPRGGVVRLAARPRGTEIAFSVEDDGPGFPAEDFPRLFEPFFTRRKGGTGLGLAIVQRIVTEQGGTVTPANRLEGGARVEVTLPSARAGSADREPARTA